MTNMFDVTRKKQKHKKNLYYINCSMFTKSNNTKLKCEMDGKINLIIKQCHPIV